MRRITILLVTFFAVVQPAWAQDWIPRSLEDLASSGQQEEYTISIERQDGTVSELEVQEDTRLINQVRGERSYRLEEKQAAIRCHYQ
jgi:hypothetical protein